MKKKATKNTGGRPKGPVKHKKSIQLTDSELADIEKIGLVRKWSNHLVMIEAIREGLKVLKKQK